MWQIQPSLQKQKVSILISIYVEMMLMEKFLRKIAETQELEPEDKLSAEINRYAEDELDEFALDMVSAAGHDDYARFMERFGRLR